MLLLKVTGVTVTLYLDLIQKELFYSILDRVQAYEIVKNSWEAAVHKPLTTNEELRQATLELYVSACKTGNEPNITKNMEAVNSLLDKLMPEIYVIDNPMPEIPDLIGERRQNSNLRAALPYMAKNLEGKLREFVTLLSSNSNIQVTEQDKRESNTSVTEPNNHNIGKAHTCLICSESFTSKRKDSKYCSSRCKQIAYRERKESA
jgi:hypothetical protein